MLTARKSIRGLVILLVVALGGLLAVQVHLMRRSLASRQQAFERDVRSARAATARQLEFADIARRATAAAAADSDVVHVRVESAALEDAGAAGADRLENIVVRVGADTVTAGALGHGLATALAGSCLTWITPGEASAELHARRALVVRQGDADLARRLLEGLGGPEPRPLAERVAPARLDSLLRANLLQAGIATPHVAGVLTAGDDSLVLGGDPADAPDLRRTPFRARLFPLDTRPPFHDLAVHLPAARAQVWRRDLPLLAATVAFTAIVVACFVAAIRTILSQRRLAARISGFVDNMTHEFKTPLATLSLASETIARPDVLADPERVRRYNGMIADETRRLGQQVEKILQLAQLEAGDSRLSLAPLDLHRLLARTADGFALRVAERGGSLETALDATRTALRGDPVHLANVFGNLLDNAVKYGGEAPRIRLSTRDADGAVLVRVADDGPGLDAADAARVFEKYYRCDTGNRHDVKGFGLGLSYVKLMVEAHGGAVVLRSRPGAGTAVEVRLPLDREEVPA